MAWWQLISYFIPLSRDNNAWWNGFHPCTNWLIAVFKRLLVIVSVNTYRDSILVIMNMSNAFYFCVYYLTINFNCADVTLKDSIMMPQPSLPPNIKIKWTGKFGGVGISLLVFGLIFAYCESHSHDVKLGKKLRYWNTHVFGMLIIK